MYEHKYWHFLPRHLRGRNGDIEIQAFCIRRWRKFWQRKRLLNQRVLHTATTWRCDSCWPRVALSVSNILRCFYCNNQDRQGLCEPQLCAVDNSRRSIATVQLWLAKSMAQRSIFQPQILCNFAAALALDLAKGGVM